MSDPPPRRLLDPDAPTPGPLRALLQRLVPTEPTEEVEARLEERIHQTLADEAAPAADPAGRAAG